MSFYIFKPATGKVYPQIQKMSPEYDYAAKNSVHALSREYQNLPEFVPNLDYFVLDNKSTLTDLLSVSVAHQGLLISSKLKNIFEKFSLPTHKYFPAKVKYKKLFYNYYWIHIICDLTDLVDYKNSKFFIYYNYCHNLGYININSKEDFLQKKDKIKKDNIGKTITIWAEKIHFTDKFKHQIDLFEITQFDANYYISERLKTAIIHNSISGTQIIPAENIITE